MGAAGPRAPEAGRTTGGRGALAQLRLRPSRGLGGGPRHGVAAREALAPPIPLVPWKWPVSGARAYVYLGAWLHMVVHACVSVVCRALLCVCVSSVEL